MPWPFTFGTATSPVAASNLDLMFNTAASGTAIPCSALGTNAISLTPLPTFPALTAYTELCGYRFRAATSSTGTVTLQYNGLGLLNVYHADGVTQVSTGDMVAGFEYVARFSQSLNSGSGGFFLEAPALPTAATTWNTPGGRLSVAVGNPVPFAGVTGLLVYCPYVHAFCPVYNGTSVQTVQFTSALSDANGLTMNITLGNFAVNAVYDVYLTLVAGVPTLCAISWASSTTRAVTLAVWGGFLTNNSANTAQIGTGGNITLAVHQGTFLGSFQTFNNAGNPNIAFTLTASGSGGGATNAGLSNYYNKVLFLVYTADNGAAYSYTSGTARQARGSGNNQINYLQTDSERAALFTYTTQNTLQAAAGSSAVVTGIGFDSTTAFQKISEVYNTSSTQSAVLTGLTNAIFSSVGSHFVTAMEQGDGTNGNILDNSSGNVLQGLLWL